MQIPGYTIIKKINAGGMATVFIATQHSVGRTVALKIMKSAFDKDPEFHQRFQREATIIGQLSHPNIIPIYDIGRHEGFNYISMEFLPKGSLEDKIKQGLSPQQAISITQGIAAALEKAHGKGYVHRDIKPENILFREDDSPVLTDFGIARTIKSNASMTQVGTVIGTPYYMSPEQAKGEASDGRSDLYSLGVVLYEMLTGEKLFYADSALAISVKHIHEQPPQLPAHLCFMQPLLNKLLAKKPEQRFQTARQLIEALGNVQHQKPLSPVTRNSLGPQSGLASFKESLREGSHFLVGYARRIFAGNRTDDVSLDAAATMITTPGMHDGAEPLLGRETNTANNKSNQWSRTTRFAAYVISLIVFYIIGFFLVAGNQPPSAREQWARITNSTVATSGEPEFIPLHINPVPQDARVRILNIREKYTPGLLLPEGTYHIEISHPGYATKKKWIRLNAHNATLDIALRKSDQPRAAQELPLPEMVLIPAGNFLMGDPSSRSAQQVTVAREFYMSRYEITFNEYDFFAIETNRALPDDNGWGRGERPVINVSWDDALAYINWLNKMTGKNYRLPTAPEWEYAARGNTTSAYWWGNNAEDARERANCRVGCKSWWDSFFNNKTLVVGSFPPNDFGLHDTAGNVGEWTSDCADVLDSAESAPVCLRRKVRGGAYSSKVENIAAFSQTSVLSSKIRNNLGFRLALDIPQSQSFEAQSKGESQQPRRRNIFRDLRDSIFKRQ